MPSRRSGRSVVRVVGTPWPLGGQVLAGPTSSGSIGPKPLNVGCLHEPTTAATPALELADEHQAQNLVVGERETRGGINQWQ